MCRFKKGDTVKNITCSPSSIMEVVKYENDRVLCKWMEYDGEAEGFFLEENLERCRNRK